MAEMYGGKWVFFGAVVINIIGTLLGPVTATAGYYYFIIMRILMGLGRFIFPQSIALIAFQNQSLPSSNHSLASLVVNPSDGF